MLPPVYRVYAKCSSGGEPYLCVEFTGSRRNCATFLKNKVRQGRPTHFNFVSVLCIEAAARRYLG